jgi:hypothetical protein
MADPARQLEVWLRGPVDGIEPLLMPVAHALLQAKEDLARLAAMVTPAQTWERPGAAASIGYHVQHLGGTVDRLFTYARGEALNDGQKAALRAEAAPGDPPPLLADVVSATTAVLERGLAELRTVPRNALLEPRKVGRLELPSTVLGLLFHAAEHTTRHVGQAMTTARVLGIRSE